MEQKTNILYKKRCLLINYEAIIMIVKCQSQKWIAQEYVCMTIWLGCNSSS